jgi:phosphatidylethanolamine-binding protein (PEBP) family uncharacterized protein
MIRTRQGAVHPLAGLGHDPRYRWAWRGAGSAVGGPQRLRLGRLPRPVPRGGHGPHRYRFRLHAVAEELQLASGVGVAELEQTLTGNVLAVAELVGVYER